jgi:site-specific recombinase XerD
VSFKDVERLVKACEKENSLKGLRDAAMIRVMSCCLLRISEAVNIKVDDISPMGLFIQSSKTDQEGEGAYVFVSETT